MESDKRDPYVIALYNFLIPGLGYLVLRRRVIFGRLLLLSFITYVSSGFFEPVTDEPFSFFLSSTATGKTLEGAGLILSAFAFAYDAFKETEGFKSGR